MIQRSAAYGELYAVRFMLVVIWQYRTYATPDISPSDLFATGGDRSISAVPVVLISCNNSILTLFGSALLVRRAEVTL